MRAVLHLELSEHEDREIDRAKLEAASGMPVDRLAGALEPLVTLQPGWASDRVSLRSDHTVGTVQIAELRVDVGPRLAAAEMVTLIRYVLGGAVGGWRHARIAAGRVGLDDLVCSVFADELSTLRQAGLSRNYVNRREHLQVVRGRPDFVASFPWNDAGMPSLVCRYHELTCDNLDNQLLRAALERAPLMDTSTATRRRLLEHRHAWSEIASIQPTAREHFARARSRYTRLSEHYRLAHNLAELIVLGQRPARLFEGSLTPTRGLSLNMAGLFEGFVERLLREYLHGLGLGLRSQESDRAALLDRCGRRYASVRPDAVIYRGPLPIAVVDAKYKEYWSAAGDLSPRKRIGNEDLYQLFFYAQRLQLRHALPGSVPAFIFAPLPALDERKGDVIGDRYTLVQWKAGAADSCELTLVLLPVTDILRMLESGGSFDRLVPLEFVRALATVGAARSGPMIGVA